MMRQHSLWYCVMRGRMLQRESHAQLVKEYSVTESAQLMQHASAPVGIKSGAPAMCTSLTASCKKESSEAQFLHGLKSHISCYSPEQQSGPPFNAAWPADLLGCNTGEQPERDRLQAAAKLISNHEAVTKFAARGCGEMGTRAFTAELSDPYAKPGMQHIGSVDAGEAAICTVNTHNVVKEGRCASLNDYHRDA